MTTKSLRFMTRAAVAFVLWVPVVTSVVSADKVADFKLAVSKAANNEGCEAIPYETERKTCKAKQDEKNTVCKDFDCEKDKVEKALDTLKEKRRNLADAKSRKNEEAIPNLERAIKELETYLEDNRYDARNRRVRRCEDCIAAREAVQRVFADVRKKFDDEKDNAALQDYIATLVRYYEAEFQNHMGPIRETINALENCKWVSAISYQ